MADIHNVSLVIQSKSSFKPQLIYSSLGPKWCHHVKSQMLSSSKQPNSFIQWNTLRNICDLHKM